MKSFGSESAKRTRYKESLSLDNSDNFMKTSFRLKQNIHSEEEEYRNSFFECLNSVRKEIAGRRSSEFNPALIKSLSQFREADKVRVMSLFLQNEKLEAWMYEKLFPSSFLVNKISTERTEKDGFKFDRSASIVDKEGSIVEK